MDLIDRQAAIDAMKDTFKGTMVGTRVAVDAINRLPSAEPNLQPTCNQLATEIIRCKDCKHRFLQNGIWQCPFTIPASENHFCGYAERRTDE